MNEHQQKLIVSLIGAADNMADGCEERGTTDNKQHIPDTEAIENLFGYLDDINSEPEPKDGVIHGPAAKVAEWFDQSKINVEDPTPQFTEQELQDAFSVIDGFPFYGSILICPTSEEPGHIKLIYMLQEFVTKGLATFSTISHHPFRTVLFKLNT